MMGFRFTFHQSFTMIMREIYCVILCAGRLGIERLGPRQLGPSHLGPRHLGIGNKKIQELVKIVEMNERVNIMKMLVSWILTPFQLNTQ